MIALWLVLANTAAQRYQRQLLIAGVSIAAVLLVAALILAWVRRLQQRHKQSLQLNAGDQLSQFRVLYERGEISSEEFQRLRVLLTGRMKEEIAAGGVPAAPSVTEAPKNNGPVGQNGTPPPPQN